MKRFALFITFAILASGCSKELGPEDGKTGLFTDCIAITADAGSKVTIGTTEDGGSLKSEMSWEKGDVIKLIHDGSIYSYATEDSGRNATFYAIDGNNALREIKEGQPLFIYYNVSSMTVDGCAEMSINEQQEEGQPSNKVSLCATITKPEVKNGKISATFESIVPVLEFNIKAPMDLIVDKVVFSPSSVDAGYTSMLSGTYDPGTKQFTVSGEAVGPMTLSLARPVNLAEARSFKFIVGAFKMVNKGATLSFFNGETPVYEKQIWTSRTVDFTGAPVHYYQPLSDIPLELRVRASHPRLFFTAEDIPSIRENAAERQSKELTAMRGRIDPIIDLPISFPDPLAATGESNTNHEYGFRASDAAMLWVVTQEKKYLDYTKKVLTELTDYYKLRNDNNLNITWYNFSTICSLCAYDWIYNDLTEAERKEMGTALYNEVYDIAWHTPSSRKSRYRENVSDYKSGCYGTNFIPWYLAIAFYGDGIDDAGCDKMFDEGYAQNMDMVKFRAEMAGTEGGAATSCPNYSISTYPLADFNFIRTLKSATGYDISEELVYVFKYLDYINWNTLPGNLEFGAGDTNHYKCSLPTTDIHFNLEELAAIYGPVHPEVMPEISRLLKRFSSYRQVERYPFIRLLHDFDLPAASERPMTPDAVYLEKMGQAYMRSGVGENDTYALFTCGGVNTQHKHFDNNNFVIFKNGYRALDSGSRPEPGLHLPYYYARTVAHNCVTIRMPGETMPKYWGSPAEGESASTPIPNDGGQCDVLGSVMKSFRPEQDYVAISSDASACYSPSKASLVEREFIWIKPDIFVIFDRVESRNASYPKTWLFHTSTEPKINGNVFSEEYEGGKTIVKTLYPADAVISKTGGPGKQFWSDGRNWPIPADRSSTIPPDDWPLMGQWRVEVTPGTAALKDCFLHLLQVGSNSLSSLPGTVLTENGDLLELSFGYGGKDWTIVFDKSAPYGSTIKSEVETSSFEDYELVTGTIE